MHKNIYSTLMYFLYYLVKKIYLLSNLFRFCSNTQLNVILMIKFGTKKEEIDLYCKNNIFPLAKNSKYEMERNG